MREIVDLAKKFAGNFFSVLTKVDEYLVKECLVVSAYNVFGNFGHIAIRTEYVDVDEFFSFSLGKGTDERVELTGVIFFRFFCGSVSFVSIYQFSYFHASNRAAFVGDRFDRFFQFEFVHSVFLRSFHSALATNAELAERDNDLKKGNADCANREEEERLAFKLDCVIDINRAKRNDYLENVANRIACKALSGVCTAARDTKVEEGKTDYNDNQNLPNLLRATQSRAYFAAFIRERKYQTSGISKGKDEVDRVEPSRLARVCNLKHEIEECRAECNTGREPIEGQFDNGAVRRDAKNGKRISRCTPSDYERCKTNERGSFLSRENRDERANECNNDRCREYVKSKCRCNAQIRTVIAEGREYAPQFHTGIKNVLCHFVQSEFANEDHDGR